MQRCKCVAYAVYVQVYTHLSTVHEVIGATLSISVLLQTFLELEKLELESDCAMILNPIVGPEPITGM